MPLVLTSYLICEKILNKLDETYELKLRAKMFNGDLLFKSDKTFIYSNIINILALYKDTNLDIRLLNNLDLIIDKSIPYIKKNKYNKEDILIILSLIVYNILYYKTLDYFNNLSDYDSKILIRDMDFIYNKFNSNIDPINNKLSILFDKSFILEFNEYDFIKYILNEGPKFPVGDRLFMLYLKKFKKILNKKGIGKIDKNYLEYYYTQNTCVSDYFIDAPNYMSKSYNDIINEVIDESYYECSKYLNKLLK